MRTQQRDLKGNKDLLTYTFRLPVDLHARLKNMAKKLDLSMAYIYHEALEKHLDELEEKYGKDANNGRTDSGKWG